MFNQMNIQAYLKKIHGILRSNNLRITGRERLMPDGGAAAAAGRAGIWLRGRASKATVSLFRFGDF